MKGAPFALIYADKAQPGAIALDEKELSLLRTLRNQAVMAFRQARLKRVGVTSLTPALVATVRAASFPT